ncbi:palmitoleoyl-protein carboxylesterase notum1-like [Daphnia carinata]|uniref:palmitoleoyl-protein carboxylesterase notum1-like n=1 Tax=Daphnia carinata TaxID=120202 RepID=UPI00257B4D3F|nr:palmitoleoyl-protein carboxylesterase notum1-like [Daphnia carinata]
MRTASRWTATVLAAAAVFVLVIDARPNQVMTPTEHSVNSPFVRRRSSGISRRSTTTPDILRQHLKQALSKCNSREPPPTQKILLKDKNAVCNDGSPAGYFIRKSYGSKRWIVFLEGGWYCYDKRSCESRWSRLRGFMTSNMWPDTRQVSGILSPDPEENPYWWNANHVYVPYCSSDSWSGSSPAGATSRFAFMGSVIIQEVLRDLLSQGLLNASKLMLTGSSAGGTGVMLNLDRATDFLRTQGSTAEVRGVTDSGWFLDNVPYAPADCQDPQRCAPTTAVQMGHTLWNGQVPSACKGQYAAQPWRCYFGHHLHRTLKTPLFIFQWLFDEAQMLADNVGPPMSKEQWDYIHAVGDDLRRTFANVSAVFSPSCISHTVLTKRDWQSIRIGDISLPQALRCWELQPYWSVSNHLTPNGHHHHRHHHRPLGSEDGENEQQNLAAHSVQHSLRHGHKRYKAANVESNPIVLLADDPEMPANAVTVKPAKNLVRSGQRAPGSELIVGTANATLIPSGRHANRNGTRKNKDEKKKEAGGGRKRNKKAGENKRNVNGNAGSNSGTGVARPAGKSGRKRQQQQHQQKGNKENASNHSSHRRNNHNNRDRKRKKDKNGQSKDETTTRPRREAAAIAADPTPTSAPEFCQHRLVDRCTWPQCNRVCPKLHNPFTGEEMDFIQLLKSFGLDMSSVANALGIDMHTLNNMDHDVLLHLLTQQTN